MEQLKEDLLKLKEEYKKCYEEKEKYFDYFNITLKHLYRIDKKISFNDQLSNDLKSLIKLSKNFIFSDIMLYKLNKDIINNKLFIEEVLLKNKDVYFRYLPIEYRNDITIINSAILKDKNNINYVINFKDLIREDFELFDYLNVEKKKELLE